MIPIAVPVAGVGVEEGFKVTVVARRDLYRNLPRSGSNAGNQIDVVENVGVVHTNLSAEPERVLASSPAQRVGERERTRDVALGCVARTHHWTPQNRQARDCGNAIDYREEVSGNLAELRIVHRFQTLVVGPAET